MAGDPNTKVRYESVQEMANRIRVVSRNIIKDLAEMDAAVKNPIEFQERRRMLDYDNSAVARARNALASALRE